MRDRKNPTVEKLVLLRHKTVCSKVKTFQRQTTNAELTQAHIKRIFHGVPLSSVGSARNPCAEALHRVPLLRVTPLLLPCFLSHSSALLSVKPEKVKNKTKTHIFHKDISIEQDHKKPKSSNVSY